MPPLLPTPMGPGWSFTFDATYAPHHVRFTVRGHPTVARMHHILTVLQVRRPELLLASGKLCPIIIDRRADAVPDPAVLHTWRAALEARQAQFTALISLVDPTRADRTLMAISLEILGQFLAPHFATVTSWADALAEVEQCHNRA